MNGKDKYKTARIWPEQENVSMKVLEDARAEWFRKRKIQSPHQTWLEEKKAEAAQRTDQLKKAGMSEETKELVQSLMTKPVKLQPSWKMRRKTAVKNLASRI